MTTTAPWPFIDPQRPTVLPEYVSASNTRASKPPVALVEALLKVKVGVNMQGGARGVGRLSMPATLK